MHKGCVAPWAADSEDIIGRSFFFFMHSNFAKSWQGSRENRENSPGFRENAGLQLSPSLQMVCKSNTSHVQKVRLVQNISFMGVLEQMKISISLSLRHGCTNLRPPGEWATALRWKGWLCCRWVLSKGECMKRGCQAGSIWPSPSTDNLVMSRVAFLKQFPNTRANAVIMEDRTTKEDNNG